MTNYKLIYFNIRGKAEVIRLLFALSGVKYEDVRLNRKNWDEEKKKINPPFGQLPLLSVDGEIFCQSNSICKYLANRFGYEGKTDLERLKTDMISHCIRDMAYPAGYAIIEENPERKEKMVNHCVKEHLPYYCSRFEKVLQENEKKSRYFVGDSLTWADLVYFHYLTTYLPLLGVDLTEFYKPYPRQKSLLELVPQTPRLAEYLATRPPSKI